MVSRKLAMRHEPYIGLGCSRNAHVLLVLSMKNERSYPENDHPALRVSVQNVTVCTFKTSPCVPASRAHVETHVRVVPAYTGTFLNVHTEAFKIYTRGLHTETHTHTHARCWCISVSHCVHQYVVNLRACDFCKHLTRLRLRVASDLRLTEQAHGSVRQV